MKALALTKRWAGVEYEAVFIMENSLTEEVVR
jgi:hypothetical protein